MQMQKNIPIRGTRVYRFQCLPYQSEKFAASLPQTCRKLTAPLFRAPEKLRNSVQKCAASGTLLAHNRLCATESKDGARTGIVCEKCATIYSYSKQALNVCPEVRQRIFFVFLFCQGIKSVRQSVPE